MEVPPNILGMWPERNTRMVELVDHYTKINPNVAIANPLPFLRAVLEQDLPAVKAEPINGCIELAKSLVNILHHWIARYQNEDTNQIYGVMAWWDVFKGLGANPLWGGADGAGGSIMPVINAAMMNYEAAMQTQNEAVVAEAEKVVYLLVLGTLVDKFAGGGPASLFMRDCRKVFD